MSRRPALRALAARLGILPAYVDQTGAEVRHTSDATRVALLAALGMDAATEGAAGRALAAIEHAARARLVPPVRVVTAPAARARVSVGVPPGTGAPLDWSVALLAEDGTTHEVAGRARPGSRTLGLPLPHAPGPGYHRLRVVLETGRVRHAAEQRLIVVPVSCPTPAERLGERRVFGLCANLYAVRSRRNWGVGDLTDLRDLVAWCGTIGAAFVGVNPLHALRNRGRDVSPYSPLTRLFRNVLYLDVAVVPELADSAEARALGESGALAAELARLRETDRVDYEGALDAKLAVLRPLHGTFAARHRGRDTARGRAYAAYLETQGRALTDFATYLALEARFGSGRRAATGWRRWPAAYHDPRAPAVAAFRAEHAEEVDFHCWAQFELDRQLGGVAAEARAHGLAVGVYQDLAIGSAADGSDRWTFPDLFVDGATLGAPPDPAFAAGQDWGLVPTDPRGLAADGYGYWVALVRAALRHAGALRIDHVMGLFRQFWVPAGHPPREGAYVRFPGEDLLGILALESQRAGALVVGEDLGTVPRGLPRVLRRRGLLSSRVLYFEQSRRGTFRASSRYPAHALVTANTHDMPTLAGFWQGRDLELRRAAGLIPNDRRLAAERARRERERRALARRLVAEGCLPRSGDGPPSGAALRGAVHAFLCRTPAALVGLWLDDLTGEVEPVNLPGVGPERYPSWTRRLGVPLEDVPQDPGVRLALAGTGKRVTSG